MASELTIAKRKRTSKRNIVLNNLIPSCEEIFVEEKTEESLEDAKLLLTELREIMIEIKKLDTLVSDLT